VQHARQDDARFSRPRHFPGVELVSVAYRDRSFPEHSHAEVVIGAVVTGAETLVVRGKPHIASTGTVLRLHADEPHANATIGPETLGYRVLYLPTEVIQPFLDPDSPNASFESPVSDDAAMFETVKAAHATLADTKAGLLEQESALAAIVRATVDPGTAPEALAASATIAIARDYIDAHFAEGFGLQALTTLTGLSTFHLVRSFKKTIGLSPLAYRNQRRVMEARGRLLAGDPVAQVALDMGYADQSHFTRQFQRIVGTSPRRYTQQ
jgi:AraC-like DNA-binding protein